MKQNKMTCKIVSLRLSQVFSELKSVTVPAVGGQLEILPGYIESFTVLKKGVITLKDGHTKQVKVVESGLCYVRNEKIFITL